MELVLNYKRLIWICLIFFVYLNTVFLTRRSKMTTEEIQNILMNLEKRLTKIFRDSNFYLIEAFDVCQFTQRIRVFLNDYSYACIPKVDKLQKEIDAVNSEYEERLKQIVGQLKTGIKIVIYGSTGHALDSVSIVIKRRVI